QREGDDVFFAPPLFIEPVRLADEERISHHPECIDIRLRRDVLTLELLWGHVQRCPHVHRPPCARGALADDLGHTETEALDAKLAVLTHTQEEVRRLEIAMHDLRLVRLVERERRLVEACERLLRREPPHAPETFSKLFPPQQLHHQERLPCRLV